MQLLHTSSAPLQATLANTGTAPLRLGPISASAGFTVADNSCPASLAVDQN